MKFSGPFQNAKLIQLLQSPRELMDYPDLSATKIVMVFNKLSSFMVKTLTVEGN